MHLFISPSSILQLLDDFVLNLIFILKLNCLKKLVRNLIGILLTFMGNIHDHSIIFIIFAY